MTPKLCMVSGSRSSRTVVILTIARVTAAMMTQFTPIPMKNDLKILSAVVIGPVP